MRTVGVLMLVVTLVASCEARADRKGENVKPQKAAGGGAVTTQLDSNSSHASTTRIRLRASGVEAIASINDTPAGNDFLALLPLRLALKDYNGSEKIAMLPRKLTTRGSRAGTDPSPGSFTYYAPWGNLAIFYKDFTYSNGLIALGRVESGLEDLARLEGEVKVTIEKIAVPAR